MTLVPTAVWVALAALVLFALAAFLHYRYWVGRLEVPLEYGLVERLRTADGATIELRQVCASPDAPPSALPPVLLVHGIAIDHRNHDVTADVSLTRYLAAQGRDCWLLTLRSAMPRVRALPVRFDAMAKHDVPIGVREVLARTGASQLDYVGFSMGGILLYAVLGREVPSSSVRRVAIVGSPAIIRPPLSALGLARHLPIWSVPSLPIRFGARMVAFVADAFSTPLHRVVYNPDNVERGVTPAILMSIQDIPGALAWDFAHFAAGDGVVRYDGEPVTTSVGRNQQPAIFFAGGADRVAPPQCVRAAFESWGGGDKRFVELSVEAGAAGDYGHGDLAMGRHAVEDIFVPLAEFLATPSAAAP